MTKTKFIEKLKKIQDNYLENMDILNDIIQEKDLISDRWNKDCLSTQYGRCGENNSEISRIICEAENMGKEMEVFGLKAPYIFDEEKGDK